MFINIHTHRRIYDAKLELVNMQINDTNRPDHYTYGIHPWTVNADTWEQDLQWLRVVAAEQRCLAIGECGLDKLSKVDFELQTRVFREQVLLANELKKPLMIHCVKSFNELINVLNHADNAVPVIVHGFNNNENIARVMVNEGYYFSFGRALLGYDSNASRAIRTVGRKRFFLETDDSDISIKYIYRKAADLLGVDEEILTQQIHANFQAVFRVDPTQMPIRRG